MHPRHDLGMPSEFLQPLLQCARCSARLEWSHGNGVCSSCGAAVERTASGAYRFLPPGKRPAPPKKEPTDSSNWNAWRLRNYEYLADKLRGLADGSIVVDLGAGPGQFRRLYERHRYVGLDFQEYPGVSIVADLTKRLPLAGGCVDAVVLSNTLEHLPEPALVLEEFHRVLRRGGFVVVLVPFLIRVHQEPHDYLRYTRYMLERLLARAGFERIDVSELGDIFDVHEVLFRDLYIVLKKNLEATRPAEEARDVRRRVLDPFRRSLVRELENLRALCGDDVGVLGDRQYPYGYGASASK
jgi:SAM-dependent methyltransferase